VIEFDCADCGRHIVLGVVAAPADGLCAHCRWWPGWPDQPVLRHMIDPEDDARPPRGDPCAHR
jgi:hypothetical protein